MSKTNRLATDWLLGQSNRLKMKASLDFLVRHGYLVLFIWVFLEQLGMPVPSIPLLLAAGALAGARRLSLGTSLSLAVLASIMSDGIWFEIARQRGSSVLSWICRISLEPDSCVRRTEDVYIRHGAKSLLVAKFIPGLAMIAPPLAGIFQMSLWRFLLFDSLGAVLWAGSFVGLGFVFSGQLEDIATYALQLGFLLIVLLGGGLAAYISWKYVERQRFLRELRIARISPQELKHKLNAGEAVQIVDLRHSLDFEANPLTLPGALHFDPEELEIHQEKIARDRDVILYCT